MDADSLINIILGMPIKNPNAVQLQKLVVEILQSGQGLKLHSGEVNLTWLAERIGVTRQCFYPGRGHDEMRAIVGILNTHISALANSSSLSVNPKQGKLNISLRKALSENERLKRELLKNQKCWNDLYNQRLIVD
ncbi:hypothetical protein C4K04_1597 [Pseudomonas chlororaphis]|uniref:Uncharacterized protein n=1 Tax=Pseudomonas chlororaphis TaxID=587753 RepID=A0A3G7TJK5_9PSED|nr:hypothetical protein [Pseudomonas chlororaphis]AZE47287.1 hypothetical protein C4K04_1597 [Pseudomonas chlororaphis]